MGAVYLTSFAKDEVIIEEGTTGDKCFILHTGIVKVNQAHGASARLPRRQQSPVPAKEPVRHSV
jgi:hypothetical protein